MSQAIAYQDDRTRTYLPPTALVWQSDSGVSGAQVLLASRLPQAVFSREPCCVLESGSGLVLDFGRELHGGVALTVNLVHWLDGRKTGPGPVQVRLRLGESVVEVMRSPNSDHAVHDLAVPVSFLGCHEYGNTGFRFVRIDLVEPSCRLELRAVHAVSLMRPLERVGAFGCSDERLDRIWDVGARTVELCMQTHLWDGIKRDRLVWIGDMHPETMVVSNVFGAHPIVPASLDLVRDHTPLGQWMNGISSYSLWWIIVQHSWYLHHGDLDYLRAQRDYLAGLLEQVFGRIGDDGSEQLDGTRFLDWPSSPDTTAVHAGLQALTAMATDRGARLCEALGEPDLARRCDEARTRLARHVPPAGTSKQAGALLALSGLSDPGEMNKAVLADRPLEGLSTFYGYYALEARALAGDAAGCLDVIRRFWGAMLDLGATTFWEDFSLDWAGDDVVGIDQIVSPGKRSIHADFGAFCYKGLRHSLCHGWAAGPTAWLTRHVLGVRPVEPGCRHVIVSPQLGDLQWAEGRVPTPHGPVRVRVERKGPAQIDTSVECPPGVELLTPAKADERSETHAPPAWF